MTNTDDYVSLHTHTEMSNFDGCGKLGDFMRKAKEQGQDAIAFTEHGSIRQLTKLHEEAEEIGIRPIYGVELYLCDDMTVKDQWKQNLDEELGAIPPGKKKSEAIYEYERDHGIIGRYHLTVLAKDQVGLSNLIKVTSLGWIKGYYKRPRVDLKCLLDHHEGLVVLSGCQSGSIGYDFLARNPAAALDKVDQLSATFGEDFYGELMPHNMVEQVEVNKGVRMISEMYGMAMVTSQDAHYIEPEDWKYQEAMLCINTRSVLSDPARFKFSTNDFWQKSRKDLEETYRMYHGYMSEDEVKATLDNTKLIAEKCQAKLTMDRFKAVVPHVPMPPEFKNDEVAYVRHLCALGWQTRRLPDLIKAEAIRRRKKQSEMLAAYEARMERELKQMEAQNVLRYFLVVWDIYKWVRAAAIEVGPGRGSVGGSLVAFLLGITDIDPMRFELLFERFLAPTRIDMPDVDMDFEDARRHEVIGYLRNTYGEDCTAQIATTNKLTGKACIQNIARIMGIPDKEVYPVTDAIIIRSSGDERASQTIEDSFKEFPVCQAFDAKYPEVLEYARKLEGQVKALGIHAAGVVVAPEPLINLVPLELRQEKSANPIIVTAVDMYGVANLGLMKLDVLGITNLTAMRRCREAIAERHGINIDWLTIPLDDQETLDNFTKHNYIGVFQFDTTSADKISEGVTYDSFEDVSAMIALDRPGTARSGLATEYLKRKKDPKAIKPIHPVIDEICKDTLGVIVYQEHVQRIFTDFAGFSPATADSLRRKIAKKYGDEAIAKEREDFVKGAVARGATVELATKTIEAIKFFGCVVGQTEISTPIGLRRIDQLRPNDLIWSSRDGVLVRNRIKAIGKSGRKLVYKIKLANGWSETASAGHWWLRTDGTWATTSQLVSGEKLSYGHSHDIPIDTTRASQDRQLQRQVLPQDRNRRCSIEMAVGTSLGAGESARYSRGESGQFISRHRESWRRQGLETKSDHETDCSIEVISIEAAGEADTWDLECELEPANYVLGSGIVSHNSYGFNKAHSVAYGLIGYRQMWLKTHYPIEFMWAMLTTESEVKEIVRTVRATRKMGISVHPPDVSTAKATDWTLYGQGVTGALINIKGCGEAASKAIIAQQPYKSFSDFCQRVERRKVHKGVVLPLLKAGALNKLVPNPKWLHDNMEAVWALVGKQKWALIDQQLADSIAFDQWSEDEANIISSSVNPLASGVDPLDIHAPLVECMRDNWLKLDDPGIWDSHRRTGWVWGRVIETKYNQVGDFHNGGDPTEEEKAKMGWGKRYANLNVEDRSGRNQRVKIDTDIFEQFRSIVDKGNATIAAHVGINPAYHSMRASFVVDLDDLAIKLGTENPDLTKLELSLWRGWDMGGFAGAHKKGDTVRVMGMVARVYKKIDKKGNEMAFITLICGDGIDREVVCFGSSWPAYDGIIHQGAVRRFMLLRERNSYILDERTDQR